jgi:hypothetical protein
MSLEHQSSALPEDKPPKSEPLPARSANQENWFEVRFPQTDDADLKSEEGETSGASSGSQEAPPTPPHKGGRGMGRRRSEAGWWIGGFLFGFIVGLALSLTYGWLLDPRPEPTTPAVLRPEDKEVYLKLIALAFAYDQDEARARARLATLNEPDIEQKLVTLTERYIDQEKDIRDITALVGLARTLGQTSSVMLAFVATPTPEPTATPTLAPTPTPRPTQTPTPPVPTETPTLTPSPTRTPTRVPTRTPTITLTPTPSRTPTPTQTPTPGPDAPFGQAQSVVLCDDTSKGGLLRIYVRDRLGAGVPGVEIAIIWSGGKDTFFTGFKPEVDSGYADFQMERGQTYELELVNVDFTGETPQISIDDNTLCPNLPGDIIPSWQVVFQQGAGG